MTQLGPTFVVISAVVGSVVGSFCNVVIERLPQGRSVLTPMRSHCAACERKVPWWRNVPVLSWILQRGRAACCGAPLGWQCAIVEAGMGALWAALAVVITPVWLLAVALPFSAGAVSVAVIDSLHMRIPHRLSATLAAVCIVGSLAVSFALDEPPAGRGIAGLLIPLACGAAFAAALQLIRWIMPKGMGGGDVAYAVPIGIATAAAAGPGGTLVAGFAAVVCAAVLGSAWVGSQMLTGKRERGDRRFAFGPYLSLGALAAIVWGADLWSWYAEFY